MLLQLIGELQQLTNQVSELQLIGELQLTNATHQLIGELHQLQCWGTPRPVLLTGAKKSGVPD